MTPRETIVITGASDGIGAAAARALAPDHDVVLVGRSPQKTAAVARELGVPHHVADFAELAQVRTLATTLLDNHPRIDVLANNAGGIMGDREVTVDGFEKTFQVNHLAQFLLTDLLLDRLAESNARVIQSASVAAKQWGRIDLDDLQNEKGYSPEKAYGDAKLANILFTRELQRRHGDRGIAAASFHPGIVGTNFASDTTHLMRFAYHTPVIKNLVTISPSKGADTLVWLATSTPGSDWAPGGYFAKRKPATSSRQSTDTALAERFWDISAQLVGR
ncbi:SDR family NAD(P)-dependent oxidoreductase [Williamsia sp. M5A3_1d]